MKIKAISKSIISSALVALIGVSGAALSDENKPAQGNSPIVLVSDALITAKIKTKFFEDTRLNGLDISVSTMNGAVTLSGTVPGYKESKIAEDMAMHSAGVTSIENNINMISASSNVGAKAKHSAKKTEKAMSDGWITTKVKSVLLADSITKGLQIAVTTKSHVVILSGAVGTQAAVDQAIHLAKGIKGVVDVDTSGLKIVKE